MKIKIESHSQKEKQHKFSIGSDKYDNSIMFKKISYEYFTLREEYFEEIIQTIEEFKKFKQENSDKIKL